jgi:hypothetical protein
MLITKLLNAAALFKLFDKPKFRFTCFILEVNSYIKLKMRWL